MNVELKEYPITRVNQKTIAWTQVADVHPDINYVYMFNKLNLPFWELTVINFPPLVKNSGAPHSSLFMWEFSWQMTPPNELQRLESANELDAVPVTRGKISIFFF